MSDQPVNQCRLRVNMANRKRELNSAHNDGDWQRGGVRLPCKTCLKMPKPGFVLAAEGKEELKKSDRRARTERECVISLEDLISEQIVLASLR